MKIRRFNEEITYLAVLDLVIGFDGRLVYNSNGLPIKGEVKRGAGGIIKIIQGKDGKDYPAGIDKSGKLNIVSKYINGLSILVKDTVLTNEQGAAWDSSVNYKSLLYKRPTGWVNSKIDMEVYRKVSRFSSSVIIPSNKSNPFTKFTYKLSQLEIASNVKRKDSTANKLSRSYVQSQIAMITLLNYMDEIKLHFTPSSSGLVYESYLAGFIPDSNVEDDNGSADIIADGKKYQIKLYSSISNIGIIRDNDNLYLDFYILCIKSLNKIDIYIVKTKGDNSNLPIVFNIHPNIESGAGKFSIPNVRNLNSDYLSKFEINLTNIDGKVKNLGKDISVAIERIYKDISELQYNIETLTTGIDEDGNRVEAEDDLETHFEKANTNLDSLKKSVDALFNDIKRRH